MPENVTMPQSNFDFIKDKIEVREAFKAKYKDNNQRRLLPYVLGWNSSSEEVVLCYDFTHQNPPKAGWRCYKVESLEDLGDNNKPLPDPEPECDCDGQNCVRDIEICREEEEE